MTDSRSPSQGRGPGPRRPARSPGLARRQRSSDRELHPMHSRMPASDAMQIRSAHHQREPVDVASRREPEQETGDDRGADDHPPCERVDVDPGEAIRPD